MDRTEQYILMADCEDIQKPKREQGIVHGDYVYSPTLRNADIFCGNPGYRYGMMEAVWLPRQEDLQAMVYGEFLYSKIAKFYKFALSQATRIDYRFTSMEQLWLAFVMLKLHSKVWNGTEWVLD